jgi:hypothetical protein
VCTHSLINYQINFICNNKVRIGGYWLCDPMRLMTFAAEKAKRVITRDRGKRKDDSAEQSDCVVYVSGGREVEFGYHFLDFLIARKFELHLDQGQADVLGCEVHIFPPGGQVRLFVS